jgi:urease accessory protein
MTATGTLSMAAKVKNGRTVLHECYYDGALKVSRPVYLADDHPTFYLMHIGGGYVGGDVYNYSFTLEEGAKLSLTTQSAAKVYKTLATPAKQEMNITLKKDSFLSLVQDPLILYEHARYVQTATIHLEQGASLLMTDILTPGWSESGELFTYDSIRSKVKVYREGRLMVLDHLYLNMKEQLSSVLLMEGYTHFGSLLFLHDGLDAEMMRLLEEAAQPYEQEARIGVSVSAAGGAVVRVLANRTQVIEAIFTTYESFIREQLLRQPSVHYRKY